MYPEFNTRKNIFINLLGVKIPIKTQVAVL